MVDTSSLESWVLRGTARLPRRLTQRLTGPAVVVEGQTLDHDMAVAIALAKAQRAEMDGVPVSKARRMMARSSRLVGGHQPIGAVTDRTIDGPGGPLRLRFYTPRGVDGPTPALVFFHGGGFVMGDLDTHDALCRFVAEHAQVRIVAVDYRLAPESPFPAAVEDAVAAWRWVHEHATGLAIDAARIAVGGDSAGGNLAAVVSQEMVHWGGPVPAFQWLIYPVTDFSAKTASRERFADGFILTDALMDVFESSYLVGDENRTDPRLSPLHGDVTGLPPAYLVTAGFDPLRDEGEAYARKMSAAGVKVSFHREAGLVHSFASMVGYGTSAPAAMRRAARALRKGLSS